LAELTLVKERQKKIILEIIRIIDENLSTCFPQIDRNNFLETFNDVILKHKIKQDFSFQRDESKSLKTNKSSKHIKELLGFKRGERTGSKQLVTASMRSNGKMKNKSSGELMY
jgi:hypothetical protein